MNFEDEIFSNPMYGFVPIRVSGVQPLTKEQAATINMPRSSDVDFLRSCGIDPQL